MPGRVIATFRPGPAPGDCIHFLALGGVRHAVPGGRGAAGVGYLLKDRVAEVAEFADALARVGAGGTALDPEVVSQLLGASRQAPGLAGLTPREREVLALMADGRSNAGIAAALVLSAGAVEKHAASIFGKLGLPPSGSDTTGGYSPCCATWGHERPQCGPGPPR